MFAIFAIWYAVNLYPDDKFAGIKLILTILVLAIGEMGIACE